MKKKFCPVIKKNCIGARCAGFDEIIFNLRDKPIESAKCKFLNVVLYQREIK